MKNLCVFAGSSEGSNKNYKYISQKLGEKIALNKYKLIYGGGQTGLMGSVANSCLQKGGQVIGFIPKFLKDIEVHNDNLPYLVITETMHERKKLMYDNSSVFAVLPGGIGTLDETMEVLTWKQLGLLKQEVYIINIDGYWDQMIDLLKNIIHNGFMNSSNIQNFKVLKNEIELENIFHT